MRHVSSLRRIPESIRFWALAGVALLVSHDAVFAVQVGPGEGLVRVLRDNGHEYWAAASTLLAITGLLVAGAVATRILGLRRRAIGLAVGRDGGDRVIRRLGPQWARLLATVALAFAVQENAEHFVSHGHLIGPGALFGPEYPLAVPVIGAITLIAALVSALLTGAEASLLAAIATALARHPHSPRRLGCRPPLRLGPPRLSLLAHAGAGRAPPAVRAA